MSSFPEKVFPSELIISTPSGFAEGIFGLATRQLKDHIAWMETIFPNDGFDIPAYNPYPNLVSNLNEAGHYLSKAASLVKDDSQQALIKNNLDTLRFVWSQYQPTAENGLPFDPLPGWFTKQE